MIFSQGRRLLMKNADASGNLASADMLEFRRHSLFLVNTSRMVCTASRKCSKPDRSQRQPLSDRIRSVMADLSRADTLNRQFGISGLAQLVSGNGGLPKLEV